MGTTETRQKSCEERISHELDGRLTDMRKWLKAYERACQLNAGGAIEQQRNEEPIGYSKYTVHSIEFSSGGPQDYFDVWEQDGEIVHISYHFLDWFDGAVRWLEGDEFAVAEKYLGPFTGVY